MLELPLSKGRVAIIDDSDFVGVVAATKWHWVQGGKGTSGYATAFAKVNGRRKSLWLHKVIVGCPEGFEVDHKNGDSLDNRRENLRICTRQQNVWNRRGSRPGFKGVFRHGRKYRAKIMINRQTLDLGGYLTPIEAARAYDRAAIQHFGEFARPNFSPDRDWLFPCDFSPDDAAAWLSSRMAQ